MTASFLKFTDQISGRSAVVRTRPEDREARLDLLLGRYLQGSDQRDQLLQSGAVNQDTLRELRDLADLVYGSDHYGRLDHHEIPGTRFRQDGQVISPQQVPSVESQDADGITVEVIEVEIDRSGVGYGRNWTGFHRRRWETNAVFYETFVAETMADTYGERYPDGPKADPQGNDQIDLLYALASRIWNAPFENYSRFSEQSRRFRTGDETVVSIAAGDGGICTEKVQALKFLTDRYGLESEYLLGGMEAVGEFPTQRLRALLDHFEFRFAKGLMRYWQHAALLYWIDGEPFLVDCTNGNIPFLFLRGDDALARLGHRRHKPVQVRMVAESENWYYHRVMDQHIPLDLFFAMEGWLDDADMVQVFENELGLLISPRFFVTPIPYQRETDYTRTAGEYRQYFDKFGFPCEVTSEWSLDHQLGERLAEKEPRAAQGIMDAHDRVLERYRWWHEPGFEMGLCVARLA